MATEPNYAINYDDERFKQVEAEKSAALTDVQNTYDNMINQSDSFYQEQQDAVDKWKDTQSQLQQEQTEFAIEQIEQQKEQVEKEYKKEQSAAYTDWQKESNKYGANAEAMASAGLMGTGYSESSQVAMYNTYQNRVATTKASTDQAYIALNNEITAARLANNAAQAEIALQAYQQKVELALQGFQYQNELLTSKLNQELAVKQMYSNEYQNVLAQINQENALAEQVRQYNASLAEEQRQYNASIAEEQRQFDATYNYEALESDYKALLKALEDSSTEEEEGVYIKSSGDYNYYFGPYSNLQNVKTGVTKMVSDGGDYLSYLDGAIQKGLITEEEAIAIIDEQEGTKKSSSVSTSSSNSKRTLFPLLM